MIDDQQRVCPFTNGDIDISKLNSDSLVNAFCNDNNILKLEDVQRSNELARIDQRRKSVFDLNNDQNSSVLDMAAATK